MANIYINKNEQQAIDVAINVLQSFLDSGAEDIEVDGALNDLISLNKKVALNRNRRKSWRD